MTPDADSHFLFHGVIKLIPLSPSRRKGLCFPCRLPHRYHFGEVTIRTTGIRGKVGVVAYPLDPLPRFFSEVDKFDDLRKRHNAAELAQPLVHEIQLLADFDHRKDTHSYRQVITSLRRAGCGNLRGMSSQSPRGCHLPQTLCSPPSSTFYAMPRCTAGRGNACADRQRAQETGCVGYVDTGTRRDTGLRMLACSA
jgi:hypothetical protein